MKMRITKTVVLKALGDEIEWCKGNIDKYPLEATDYNRGFVRGLEHAIYIIKKIINTNIIVETDKPAK